MIAEPRDTYVVNRQKHLNTYAYAIIESASSSLMSSRRIRHILASRQNRIDEDFHDERGGDVQAPSAAKKTSKKAALLRLGKLWDPFNKRMVLTALRVCSNGNGNYEVTRTSSERLFALQAAWSPVFTEKPVNVRRGRSFLDQWARPLDFSLSRPPCI